LLAFCATLASACQRSTPANTSDSDSNLDSDIAADPAEPEAGFFTRRIVAIGDVHGDLASALEALELAGAVNADDVWVGGDLIVVQLGDQTDRGDDELEILEWFEALQADAAAAGGEFHSLLGNHEIMNVQQDWRYVTPGGFEDFADFAETPDDPSLEGVDPALHGRIAAFRPGGPWATRLAEHPVVLQLGDTVFVHGGLEPEYAALGLDAINESVAAWMRGEAEEPDVVRGADTPIWSRDYSSETGADDCATLAETLELLGAERMVVGHTVQQEGITSACDGRVWRVDVGLADYYGGETQVLEIVGDEVGVLR
jgi:hypothetical protein